MSKSEAFIEDALTESVLVSFIRVFLYSLVRKRVFWEKSELTVNGPLLD